LVKRRKCGHDADHGIDVLILGVENSLWLGQQFAADLSRIFPLLDVTAMSSNWVLGLLQQAHGHVEPTNFALSRRNFRLSPEAVVLSISQSGTTYPTVWATRLLARLNVSLFAMSAEFDTVLANSIGQDLSCNDFSKRLFSTMCGIRPCEPSTVATIAMHHTLTKLLFFAAEYGLRKSLFQERVNLKRDTIRTSSSALPDCELRLRPARQLSSAADKLIDAAEVICGITRHGVPIESNTREKLLEMGTYLAHKLTEGWVATLLAALYVYITVVALKPIATGIWLHVASATKLAPTDPVIVTLNYVVGFIDAHIYVFLGAILISIHRKMTGRRLITRYCARTLVIVETTTNYKLLRAYASKLRALAFRFTTFGVAGQNPVDHFVHEMTHLTTSDVVIVSGRTDGRLGALAATEASSIMSLQQARFIASKAHQGIEALCISHNPWTRPGLFSRFVALPTDHQPTFASAKMLSSDQGPHAPSHVMSNVAALCHGDVEKIGAEDGKDNPEIQVEALLKRMGAVRISKNQAKDCVIQILREQQEKLGINIDAMNLRPVADFIDRDRRKKLADKKEDAKSQGGGLMKSLKRNFSFSQMADEDEEEKPAKAETKEAKPKGLRKVLSRNFSFGEQAAPKAAAPKDELVGASEIMSTLYGIHMQELIRSERSRQRREQAKKDIIENRNRDLLDSAFGLWHEIIDEIKGREKVERAAKRADQGKASPGGADRGAASPAEAGHGAASPMSPVSGQGDEQTKFAWRVAEVYRTMVKRQCSRTESFHLSGIFRSWRSFAVYERLSANKPAPRASDDGASGIGADLMAKLRGEALLAELGTLECLFESRVLAAERLLSFMVMFHTAIKPLSLFPVLNYDIDRSESRLRVASTPAPVPFVEAPLKPIPTFDPIPEMPEVAPVAMPVAVPVPVRKIEPLPAQFSPLEESI